MAQTEHLPIYKATYNLCLYLEQIVQHFWGSRVVKGPGVLGREMLRPKRLLAPQTERL
jgi:hypothetical protein